MYQKEQFLMVISALLLRQSLTESAEVGVSVLQPRRLSFFIAGCLEKLSLFSFRGRFGLR